MSVECVVCKQDFIPKNAEKRIRLYCSVKCTRSIHVPLRAARRRAVREIDNRLLARPGDPVCGQCSQSFRPKEKDRTKFCSRECAFANTKERRLVREELHKKKLLENQKTCKHCKQAGHGWSNPAAPVDCRRAYRAYCMPLHCHGCNVSVGRYRTLCDKCRDDRAAAYKKMARTIRRRKERSIIADKIVPTEVFKRDGWRCQRCEVKCSVRIDVNDDRFANLDHIQPISRGGTHTLNNVQLLCRKCNTMKGATVHGDQLRLAM